MSVLLIFSFFLIIFKTSFFELRYSLLRCGVCFLRELFFANITNKFLYAAFCFTQWKEAYYAKLSTFNKTLISVMNIVK